MAKIDGITRRPLVRTFEYDFATLGGATGAKTLVEINGEADGKLNEGDMIVDVITECLTAATSGGAATIKLGITGNDDAFEAATAYTDDSYDTVNTLGRKITEMPLRVNTSGGVSVIATIGTAALTAGKFRVHVLMA